MRILSSDAHTMPWPERAEGLPDYLSRVSEWQAYSISREWSGLGATLVVLFYTLLSWLLIPLIALMHDWLAYDSYSAAFIALWRGLGRELRLNGWEYTRPLVFWLGFLFIIPANYSLAVVYWKRRQR